MLSALKPGDEVITIGGIYGDVIEVEEDKVVLEIAEDVHIEVTRKAIANIVPPEVEEEDAELEEAGELEPAAEAEQADSTDAQDGKVEERTR